MQFHPRDLSELDDLTEEHLGFSALSDGLGFKKSNKPVARETESEETKKMSFSGIGAVSAGPAMPVLNAREKVRVAAAAPVTAKSILQEPAASPFLRLAAFVIDSAVVLIPLVLCWKISFRAEAWEIFRADIGSAALLYSMILASYLLLAESFGGQSLGKMSLDLHVVEDDKYQKPIGLRQAAARLVLLVLGTAALGIDFLAILRDPKRRPLHDRYTGSIVRRKA